MRKTMIVSMLLLAACNQQGPQQTAQAPAGPAPVQKATAPAVAGTNVDFKAARIKKPLPGGIELPFPYHRLNDNATKANVANSERRVYVEIRQITPQAAEEALTGLLIQSGFSEPEANLIKGVRELTFSRADGVKLTVKINPRHKKPKAPDATGTVHIVWQPA